MDNQQNPLRTLELFAGAGGGILGGHLLGEQCICAVEYNAYARSVLLARQNDGTLPPFPIWDDVCTFDGRPWAGRIDLVSGGFPCQDISAAGKGAGLEGERSGLWREMRRIISEIRPCFVRVENSPMLTSRGMARVLGDLSEMGFDAKWGIVSAADTGAPHKRERIWIMAYAKRSATLQQFELAMQRRWQEQAEQAGLGSCSSDVAGASRINEQGLVSRIIDEKERSRQKQRSFGSCSDGFKQWPTEPEVGRVADGVALRVDRLKAIGNGQVPRVAATAWRILSAST